MTFSVYSSEADVTRRLQAVEQSNDLLRYQIGRWSVWPLLRFSISRAMQRIAFDEGADGFRRKEVLRLVAADAMQLMALKRSQFVVKTYASYHVEVRNGRKRDIYFDDIVQFANSVFKIEVLNGPHFLGNRRPNVIRRNISHALVSVAVTRLSRAHVPAGARDLAVPLSKVVTNEFGLTAYTPERVASIISEFHWATRLHKALLRRLRPSCVLLAEIGDWPITAAARELGIPVVEFQHGITHRFFPGNSWDEYAVRYKPCMPIPDRIFLYGPFWASEMAANGFWNDELKVVGSLRVDLHRKRAGRTRGDDTVKIVFTAQGVETTRVIEFLKAFDQKSRSTLKYKVVLKMHPAYFTNLAEYAAAFGNNSRFEIVPGDAEPNTFDLLRSADLHLSIYSFCHYEALALGVPTAVLPLPGSENVAHLVEAEHAQAPSSPEDLSDLVNRIKSLQIPNHISDHYFASDALNNVRRELDAVTSRRR